jgi:hypothetical protein
LERQEAVEAEKAKVEALMKRWAELEEKERAVQGGGDPRGRAPQKSQVVMGPPFALR